MRGAYAVTFPRRWYVAGLVQFASFFTYLPYLFRQEPIGREYLALAMTAALGIVAWDFAKPLLIPGSSSEEKARAV